MSIDLTVAETKTDVELVISGGDVNVELGVTQNLTEIELLVSQQETNIELDIVPARGPAGQDGQDGEDFDPGTTWFGLVTGWNIEPTLNATIPSGEVWTYQYLGGVTYYRYIADDGSEDAFYSTFNNPTVSGLIVRRRITL